MKNVPLFSIKQTTFIVGLALMGQSAYSVAAPFDSCPSQAYLFQSKPVQVYGLNLVTGQSTLLQGNTGTTANVNGVGFDFDSRYIYGYDTTNKKIVRLAVFFKIVVIICLVIKQLLFLDLNEPHQLVHSS